MKPPVLSRLVLVFGMAYVAAFYASTSVGARQGAPSPQAPSPPQIAEAPEKALVLKACAGCHDAADKITQERHSDGRWAEIVSQMLDLGMKVSEEDATTILGYLKAHYGCVPKQESGNCTAAPRASASTSTPESVRAAQTLPDPQGVKAKSVWSGVYSEAQATRGMALYDATCANCHGDDLAGIEQAPALTGEAFQQVWDNKPLNKMLARFQEMPPTKPKSLTPEQYTDILSYILQANDMPAGPTVLSADSAALAEVVFVQPGDRLGK